MRHKIHPPCRQLSTGIHLKDGYSQSHSLLLGESRPRSSVTDVDFLQRYRLRQFTRAVYDAEATECSEDTERQFHTEGHTSDDSWGRHGSRGRITAVQSRRLMDYPAALAAIVVCLLVLIAMVVRSAAWGVDPEPTSPDADEATSQLSSTAAEGRTPRSVGQGRQEGESGLPQSALSPPPGHRRHQGAGGDTQSTATSTITIHVEGAVAHPGIVSLPQGARTHEALQAAGGATPEAALREINLARKLTDGEYLYVPHSGEDPQAIPAPAQASPATTVPSGTTSPSNAASGTGAGGCVDINTADLAGLQALNGVGPALAQRILDARQSKGPFMSLDDVDAISGIGPAMLRKVEAQLCPLQGR